MTPAYRIFRIGHSGRPATLFHAWQRSRTLPTSRWLLADQKLVTNPGKKDAGQRFVSGWHVVPTQAEIEAYLRRFKRPEELVACRVYVGELRDKPGSVVKLADLMLVRDSDWRRACSSHRKKYPSSQAATRLSSNAAGSRRARGSTRSTGADARS